MFVLLMLFTTWMNKREALRLIPADITFRVKPHLRSLLIRPDDSPARPPRVCWDRLGLLSQGEPEPAGRHPYRCRHRQPRSCLGWVSHRAIDALGATGSLDDRAEETRPPIEAPPFLR